jgi:hypothetical protein
MYKARHLIENLLNKHEEFRPITMRYDKTPEISSPQFTSRPQNMWLI